MILMKFMINLKLFLAIKEIEYSFNSDLIWKGKREYWLNL